MGSAEQARVPMLAQRLSPSAARASCCGPAVGMRIDTVLGRSRCAATDAGDCGQQPPYTVQMLPRSRSCHTSVVLMVSADCPADLILDVALEVHRGVKTGADDLADVAGAADAQPQPAVCCHCQLRTITQRRECAESAWRSGQPVSNDRGCLHGLNVVMRPVKPQGSHRLITSHSIRGPCTSGPDAAHGRLLRAAGRDVVRWTCSASTYRLWRRTSWRAPTAASAWRPAGVLCARCPC